MLKGKTVTVYHPGEDGIQRRVVEDCIYQHRTYRQEAGTGVCEERKFCLLIPGQDPIVPGDRVYDGIGPEEVDWESFVPANVPGLSQAQYVTRYDTPPLCHTEVGRK